MRGEEEGRPAGERKGMGGKELAAHEERMERRGKGGRPESGPWPSAGPSSREEGGGRMN
jgi:hypothetical protein